MDRVWIHLCYMGMLIEVQPEELEDQPYECLTASFPSTHGLAKWTLEQSGYGNKNGVCMWAQQHGLPFTKAVVATATHWVPKISTAKINTESLTWHHIPGRPAVLWWHADHISIVGEVELSSLWNRQVFWIEVLLFLPTMILPKITIHGIIKYLFHKQICHITLLLTRKLILQQIMCGNWLLSTKFTGLTIFSITLKHGLTEWWNGLFTTQLRHQVCENTL